MTTLLMLLAGCVITEADIDRRLDFDDDGFNSWQYGGPDCDDGDGNVRPDADELCDGIDSNCDGVDEDLTDADGDGVTVCENDCDDHDPARAPGLQELCDAIDNDCDNVVDNGLNVRPYYPDLDADGYGDGQGVTFSACVAPPHHVLNGDDCNDADAARNPTTTWHLDHDNDGYGRAAVGLVQCAAPIGHVLDATDCDDANQEVHPNAIEQACNLVDDDCDGDRTTPEFTDADNDLVVTCEDCDDTDHNSGLPLATYFLDTDGDGFGDQGSTALSGCPTASWSATNDDCSPQFAAIHEAVISVPSGADITTWLEAACDDAMVTLPNEVFVGSPTLTRTMSITGNGATLQGAITVTAGSLTVDDARVIGSITSTRPVTLVDVDVLGHLDLTGASHSLTNVALIEDQTTTIGGGSITLTDVFISTSTDFDANLLELVDFSGAVLDRVEVEGSTQSGQSAIYATTSDTFASIAMTHVYTSGSDNGIELVDVSADIAFTTVLDYGLRGLWVHDNTRRIDIRDSILGRPNPLVAGSQWAIEVTAPADLGFVATYLVEGGLATGSDDFDACTTVNLPAPMVASCAEWAETGVLDSDDAISAPTTMVTPDQTLYGRMSDRDDCHGYTAPDPDSTEPPSLCYRPGHGGGVGSTLEPW